jgi:hypothetical protein
VPKKKKKKEKEEERSKGGRERGGKEGTCPQGCRTKMEGEAMQRVPSRVCSSVVAPFALDSNGNCPSKPLHNAGSWLNALLGYKFHLFKPSKSTKKQSSFFGLSPQGLRLVMGEAKESQIPAVPLSRKMGGLKVWAEELLCGERRTEGTSHLGNGTSQPQRPL